MEAVTDPLEQAVVEALHGMAEVLVMQNGRQVSERFVNIWVTVLRAQGVSPAEVLATAAMMVTTAKFFPTPAEFLAALRPAEDRDAAAELAWQRTLNVIRRYGRYASLEAADLGGDGAALWAIERAGWARLCTEMTEDNRAIFRAEYVRVYHLAAREGEALAYLPGQWERLNLAGGQQLDPALAGRPDWRELPESRSAVSLPQGGKALAAPDSRVAGSIPESDIPGSLRQWADRSGGRP